MLAFTWLLQFFKTTQRHRNTTELLISLSHPHHQWILSLISSTSSQFPLMMRAYPPMKKGQVVAQGLTHQCVLLHEMPHSSLHIWRPLRPFKHHRTFSSILGSKRLAYVFGFLSETSSARIIIITNTIMHTLASQFSHNEHYYLSITF